MMRRNIALIPAAGVRGAIWRGKTQTYVEINGKNRSCNTP